MNAILRALAGVDLMMDTRLRPRDYVRPSATGFAKDHANLVGDVVAVGRDIRHVISKKISDKQTNKDTSEAS